MLSSDKKWAKVLVFDSTKKMVDLLFETLEHEYPGQIGVIHSNKSQNYRLRTVQKFDMGEYRVLLATDLIARGLDFDGITHVVNIDTPDDPENYIHRVGRTARANAEGIAVTFVNQIEITKELYYLKSIENLMNQKIDILPLPKNLEISTNLIEYEVLTYQQRNATKDVNLIKDSKGALHQKKQKNIKVNKAKEKRLARKAEKFKSKKRGKKK